MTPGDPTDDALAAIASILDHPPGHRVPETPAPEALAHAPVQADGYSKTGPGPMAAIRFKWRVRRGEHEAYFVDETVGESSAAITIGGPMSADDAVKLVDQRESEARERFEQIRHEMTGGGPASDAQDAPQAPQAQEDEA